MDDAEHRSAITPRGEADADRSAGARDEPIDFSYFAFEPPTQPRSRPGLPLRWRHVFAALGVIWGVNVATTYFASLGALVYGGATNQDPVTLFEALHSEPSVVVLVSCVMTLFAATVGWYVACARLWRSAAEGLGLRRVSRAAVVEAIVLGIAAAVLSGVYQAFIPEQPTTPVEKLIATEIENSVHQLPWVTLFALLFVPPFEELYFRGFLYTSFRELASVRFAFPVVVLWFALAHAAQLGGNLLLVAWMVVGSVLLTWQRERHDSLVPPILCHWVYNGSLAAIPIVAWWLTS